MRDTHKSEMVPGYFELLWLFFMQPVTLHHRLKACGIDPDASYRPWRSADHWSPEQSLYSHRLGVILFTATPIIATVVSILFQASGLQIRWDYVAYGVAVGVAVGVAYGVARGVAFGVAGGVAYGVAVGVARGVAVGVAGGVAFGVAGGVAFGVAVGVAGGVAVGVAGGVAVGVAVGVGVGVAYGLAVGVAVGVAFGVAIPVVYLRIPVYLLEMVLQSSLYLIQRTFKRPTLALAPVLHHDLSYLPHPFLGRHILTTAASDPALARQVLDACAIAPGQRKIGRNALYTLQAREMRQLAHEGDFVRAKDLRGEWLPGMEGANDLLLALSEIARYFAAASGATQAFEALRRIEEAEQRLEAFGNQLRSSSELTAAFRQEGTLEMWRQVAQELRKGAEEAAARQLPNPFHAFAPLDPELGRETFRGREAHVKTMETILSDPKRSNSMALLGPRRCGKTSLLKMLPDLLPDTLCVFYDLQDNPIDSPAAFFEGLAERAHEQIRRDRRIELPTLPEGPPFESASRWLDQLEELDGGYRVLICFDEFERLEDLFPGTRRELLRLMGLLRATIQHKRKVRLLVAGAAPFDELDSMWDDHFINVREVSIGHLDHPTSLELLHRPLPDFPPEAIPVPVAEAVFQRTGGQPFLLQLYGLLLLERLNEEERREALPEDVTAVEGEVLTQAASYFRHTYKSAEESGYGPTLQALAVGGATEIDLRARRWLERRCLLSDKGLTIPVLGRWIHEETLT